MRRDENMTIEPICDYCKTPLTETRDMSNDKPKRYIGYRKGKEIKRTIREAKERHKELKRREHDRFTK